MIPACRVGEHVGDDGWYEYVGVIVGLLVGDDGRIVGLHVGIYVGVTVGLLVGFDGMTVGL